MYIPIKMTPPESDVYNESMFDLNYGADTESIVEEKEDTFFSEAVFSDGKKSLIKIEEILGKIKGELMARIAEHEENAPRDRKARNPKEFNPISFWRHEYFKEFEDEVQRVFGFRSVNIQPYVEKYNSADKLFESKELNCSIWQADRYPIDGLVTDEGFHDKSRSINMEIYISLGLIKLLTAPELVAVFLHEFGHSIDPALASIQYTETNVLSKYLTDRVNAIKPREKKVIEGKTFCKKFGSMMIGVFTSLGTNVNHIFGKMKTKILGGSINKRLRALKEQIAKDKTEFNRQNFTEAFADNFARMYGYGPQLASALAKMAKGNTAKMHSRVKREKDRQKEIIAMAQDALKNEHRTNVHRIRSLVKEYKADLEDPNISKAVKKQIQEDLDELEKVYNAYLNNFDDFQNRVNKMIDEELTKLTSEKAEKPVTESTDDAIYESKEGKKPSKGKKGNHTKKELIDLKVKYIDSQRKKFGFNDDKEDEIDEKDLEVILAAMKKEADKLKRDGIAFTHTQNVPKEKDTPDNRNRSKLGGYPYWPKGKQWPVFQDKPMIMLAQINLADMPNLKGYPTKGILQFFAPGDDMQWEELYDGVYPASRWTGKMKENDTLDVIYHEKIVEPIAIEDIPVTSFDLDFYGSCIGSQCYYLTGEVQEFGIGGTDQEFVLKVCDIVSKQLGKDYKHFWGLPDKIRHVCLYDYETDQKHARLGGNAFFGQCDPREYGLPMENIPLFMFAGDLLYGYGGIFTYWITKEDLAKKDFSNCHFSISYD